MSQMRAVKAKSKIKKSREDKIFDAIIYTISAILILLTLYPMYFIVIASISDAGLVSAGQIMFVPKGINFKAYEQLKNYESIWIGYRNTILYVIVGTIVTLVVNIPASYALCTSQQKLDTNFKYYLSINLISVQYGASFATFLSG